MLCGSPEDCGHAEALPASTNLTVFNINQLIYSKYLSMNRKFRKTALLMSAMALLGLGYSSNAYAAGDVQNVQQATKKITGTVVDAMGPVIGASIMEKGTTNGTVTDFDGNFSLNVKPGATIVVSFIGFKTQEIAVGNQSTFNITMEDDNAVLEEVVVVGYGVQKKKLVTGATVEVKGEDIAGRNTISPLSALQNQSPGVNIVAQSGKPGEGFNVNIRGAGTNGNTAPLYVVDGVVGDINSINPADIERIDVLKDAASCAIYGARAANGVILVTTKQGKTGKVTVNYDANVGWQNVVKLPLMLNAKQYMDIQDLTNFNAGQPLFDWSQYVDADLLAAYRNGTNSGTDWVDQIVNNRAITTSHSLNVAGGSELSKFSTGVGYQYQDGIIGGDLAKSNYRRFTLRMNSDHVIYRSNDRDIITFGENLYYLHTEQNGINTGNQYGNPLYNMISANPLVPIYNKDGEYFDYDDLIASGLADRGFLALNQYIGNPLNTLVHSSNALQHNRSHNLSATGYITISPLKGLTYKGLVYYKNWSSTWKGLDTVFSNNSNDQHTEGILNQNMSTGWNWGMTHTLNYVFDVKQHHFDVLVGTEYTRDGFGMAETIEGRATNAYDNVSDMQHAFFNNFSGRTTGSLKGYPTSDHSLLSYFGRLNYDYAEKYMFSAIIRADGSSNFADGHRWGWFPSFSAGWVISNEKFMEKTASWLSFLKIRASWGQNGNEGIGQFKYLAAYSFGDYGQYSFNQNKVTGMQGGYLSRLANEKLTWETSEQLDLGFDARFIGGKLSLNFDYYVKKTKDLLIDVPVSAINGFATKVANAGTIKNSGIEVALNWRDNIGKDFNYNVGFNIATNKNEVTEVNNGSGYINGGEGILSQGTTYLSRMEVGHPIGYFWGYKTNGVIQNEAERDAYAATLKDGDAANSLQGAGLAPGDLRFVDLNGDGVINDSDKTDLGDPHPDVTMGINLGFDFKGFDFAVSGYAALGQQIAYSYRRFGDGQFGNWTTDAYNYWHGEGTGNGRYPILLPGNTVNHINISDIYIEDGDYFRMQSITLGYNFTKIWKKSPFSQLRLYAQVQNLFTITGYKGMDPECGKAIGNESWVTGVDVGNYPQPRTFLVGVNVKF